MVFPKMILLHGEDGTFVVPETWKINKRVEGLNQFLTLAGFLSVDVLELYDKHDDER